MYVLTHGLYKQRKHAQASVKRLLAALGGGKVAVTLIKQFRTVLATQKVVKLLMKSHWSGIKLIIVAGVRILANQRSFHSAFHPHVDE